MTSDELRLGIVQHAATPQDLDGTLETARLLVERAVAQGAQLVVLPEFFSREYFPQYRDSKYLAYAEREDSGPTYRALCDWAKSLNVALVAGVYEEAAPGVLYDSAVFVSAEGVIVGRYRKAHPAAVRSLEKLYFRPGSQFPVYELAGWKVGATICYDLNFPEAARSVALNGAELIVMPFATWDEPLWPEYIRVRAHENGVYVAAPNKVGLEGDWQFQGKSTIASPHGDVLAFLSDSDNDVQVVTLERSAIYDARSAMPLYRDRRPEVYSRVTAE